MAVTGKLASTLGRAMRPRPSGAKRGVQQNVELPLRSELFSVDQLRAHAIELAGRHHVGRSPGPDRLLPRLDENEQVLLSAYRVVTEAVQSHRSLQPAGEWLLDNFYLVEEQIRTTRRHLPRMYSRQLPRLTSGPAAGYPRVYDIALELISHVDGKIDADGLRSFVAAYQTAAPLKLGELWAIPIMLRLALVENLRRVAARLAADRLDRDYADSWADRMLSTAESDPQKLILVTADMARSDPPMSSAFVAELQRRLHGHGPALTYPLTWIEQGLTAQSSSIEQLLHSEYQQQAADQVSIGNTIGSLRFLESMDWREFVEALSVVEQVLRTDPAGIYAETDFATRDACRHVVEKLAKHSPLSQRDVARTAIELAAERAGSVGPGDRSAHVGYFLLDEGLPALKRTARVSTPPLDALRQFGRRHVPALYLGAILLFTLAASLGAAAVFRGTGEPLPLILLGLVLASVGLSQMAVSLVNLAVPLVVRPRPLPRMDYSKGIPETARTLVAVPTMLTSPKAIQSLEESLEVCYLANRDSHLHFALLTDFRDAAQQARPEDRELLDLARQAIESLNQKYQHDRSDIFFLLHRGRHWNEQEQVWMGRERKRGKLGDLNALLRGQPAGKLFSLVVGDTTQLQTVKFVITLDTDTEMPREAARQLVATLDHPLNRPILDPALGRVRQGYGVLQPRVAISLASANRSWLVKIFGGEPGIDPYTRVVSDVYQDLFHEGSFIGKGIYDVDAFEQTLAGRFPDNLILSHDLVEGCHVRSGLVSDVTLYENYPSSYLVEVSRHHRWIRGDWQIARWVLPRVPAPGSAGPVAAAAGPQREPKTPRSTTSVANPLSAVSRWKIFDNLRRSLVPPALVGFILLAWFALPDPNLWVLAAVGTLAIPYFLAMLLESRKPEDFPLHLHLPSWLQLLGLRMAQLLLTLTFLPHAAWSNLDAVIRTLYRLAISHRHLLEWRTASDAERQSRLSLAAMLRADWFSPLVALAAGVFLALERPAALPWAEPLILLWFFAPAVAWLISVPIRRPEIPLNDQQRQFLHKMARRTWHFFETFVGPDDNWLPPDNYQEHPVAVIAHRTSPTNIGMSLLSNLAAYDFGYISAGKLLARTAATYRTLEKLERYQGHLLNWYDTRSLAPIPPRYISTVDSGNFVGHILTLQAGLSEMLDDKTVSPQRFAGLADTIDVVVELWPDGAQAKAARQPAMASLDKLKQLAGELRAGPTKLWAVNDLLSRLTAATKELVAGLGDKPHDERATWSASLDAAAREHLEELHYLAPWVPLLHADGAEPQTSVPSGPAAGTANPKPCRSPNCPGGHGQLLDRLENAPSLRETARMHMDLVPEIDRRLASASAQSPTGQWLGQLREACAEASSRAAKRVELIENLVGQCEEFAQIDYSFLYDKARNLLAIGYNLDQRLRDGSFYDLLASEARLASFVAIAQNRLPQDHWFALGRLLTTAGGGQVLLSWSGSMFEYLMPALVMPSYAGTLLDQTSQAAVARQIQYGRQRAVPWGISESGYNVTDANLNYQYRAFGVPGLGFKRGLGEDLVVAPYATMLALLVAPHEACANLQRLAKEGFLGPYGFFEAIDFTPSRVPVGQTYAIVRSFMVHHQGMSLLGLASRLLDRPMQRRFEAIAMFRADNLLLQEKIPKAAPFYPHSAEVVSASEIAGGHEALLRVFQTPNTPAPEIHLLSNGRYHVMVTAAGGGYSRWNATALTRWEEDATRDHRGLFVYVRDTTSGDVWSNTYQPTLHKAEVYEAIYTQARAEFHRRDFGIDLHTDIAVSPEDDVEVRRLTITNRSRVERTLELTSYAEIVLNAPAADQAHPAFSNLFVQTEIMPERQAILATRRPRSSGDQMPWMIHLMAVHATAAGEMSFETDRAQFLGRGGETIHPAEIGPSQPLSGRAGSVLDPIASIRSSVVIGPDESAVIDVVTGIAASREAAVALAEKYRDRNLADRVYDLAWTHSQVMLQHLNVSEADAQLFVRLASAIVYPQTSWRATPSTLAKNRRGQSGLWGYGISGDLPIVLLKIGEVARVDLVRQLIRAHGYWRAKGLAVDLVVWNEDNSSYRQALHDEIMGVLGSQAETQTIEKPGGIFVRRSDQIPDEDRVLFESVARLILSDSGGSLAEQADRRARTETPVPTLTPTRTTRYASKAVVTPGDLKLFNGLGGFSPDGREYVIATSTKARSPAPWANVLANPRIGTVVSESGLGYTWTENAHEHRLTPWYNDPVTDAAGEAVYLRDEESGRFWSPAPLPAGGKINYVTRHGFGHSTFQACEQAIRTDLTVYVAAEAPVKFVSIQLKNESDHPRRLSLWSYVEWVLGESRSRSMMHTATEIDAKSGALFARNRFSADFADRVAFLDVSEVSRTVTGNRTEFVGRNGRLANPAALSRVRLSGKVGPALDPCGAMQVQVHLNPGEQKEVVFILGAGQNVDEARGLVQRFRGVAPARAELEAVKAYWDRTLGALALRTPDDALNLLAGGWLVYQVLACRLWARSGYYQSGGAFGFRDQLQDVMALVYAQPHLTREHLLRAAQHQFLAGDVQHWWHPPKNRGVRTRFSDDFLWLAVTTCRYVQATGDTGVLDERLNYLEGRPCIPDEEAYYDIPNRSEETGTLYEHCLRAIDHGLKFGEHGLPLMGCGDWNDGMNLVGVGGKGESVWLAFFLFDVLEQFAEIARTRGDLATVERFQSAATTLRSNIERHAWDGQWYLRAFFDDGTPLGSAKNSECQIDALPQSWAVLSRAGDPDRSLTALNAVDRRLVHRDSRLIQLFDPPFDHFDHEPGYIKGYVPGVRENGGQYTHAAVWTIMAFAELADPRAWELFELINPLRHGATAEAIAIYKVEPYVVAADVYAVQPHVGRGGWTWYTGSAGWLYRLIVESLLGLKLSGDRLRMSPLWPDDWHEFSLDYRFHATTYQITVRRADSSGAESVTLDDVPQPDNSVGLVDDQRPHAATFVIAGRKPSAKPSD